MITLGYNGSYDEDNLEESHKRNQDSYFTKVPPLEYGMSSPESNIFNDEKDEEEDDQTNATKVETIDNNKD